MKITQVLKEAVQISAAFAFGRFNPSHVGHIAVWRTVENAAARWYIGTNPSTLGPNDPLTFEQKSAWMSEIYQPITGHIAAEQSVMTLAAKIFADLGKNEAASIAYITDADDWSWSGKLLNQYNGVSGAHGYYKFAEIVHVPSPRVSSATALRDAARADDRVAFYHASGTDPKLKVAGLTYFDTVKEAVAKYPLPVKKAKKVAEGYNDLGPEYGGAYVKGQSDDAKMTARLTRQAKAAAAKAGKTFGTSAEYRKWHARQKEKQGVAEGSLEEIDRRGFLKGMGAAAVAGAAGYKMGQGDNATLTSSSALSGADLRDPIVSYIIGFFYWCLGPFGLYKQQENRESLKIQQDIKKWIKDWDAEENHWDKGLDNNEKSISMRMRKERQLGQKEAYDWFYHEIYKESDPKGTFERFMSRVKYEHSKLLNWNKSRQESVQQGVAEGAPIVVAQAPIDVRNPKKAPQPYRNQGDIVTDTKPPSTEKRGVKGRAGQRPMPKHDVEEASLATMRDYFAGDENAKDVTKLSQMRDFFSKHKPEGKIRDKHFNSNSSYEAWLRQQKMKKIGEDDEAGEVEKTGNLIPFPKGTTKIDVEGEYDWYKLGQVISDLDDADPAQFGTGPASAMIAFGSEAEEHKYLPLLKRLGMQVHDIDQPTEGVEIIPVAEFVSRHLTTTESEKIAGRYDPADFDSMVQRLGKIAKSGPMKTVWDPVKQVYKTVPDTDKQKKIAEAVIKVVEVIKHRQGLWKK